MRQILVLGAGFAGLWSAIGAQRLLNELGRTSEARVTIVNREPFHNIRVRNYEPDLSDVCVPFAEVLDPIGVDSLVAEIEAIDLQRRSVAVRAQGEERTLIYDALVVALGSELVKPPIPGLDQHGFDVDTFAAAKRLEQHLLGLPGRKGPAKQTVIVVGAGLTGLEVATEMPGRLRDIFGAQSPARVLLLDRNPYIGSDMGAEARPVIQAALDQLGIECRTGVAIAAIREDGVQLATGEFIESATLVWCGGMRANPLVGRLGLPLDALGRIKVDSFLRVEGQEGVFAAGDAASVMVDAEHCSVMSCQHGRPMGRYAGHNVVAQMFGRPMLPLAFDWYATVVDLGPAGAIYTKGFERRVHATGGAAKQTKQTINRQRIYPPRTGKAEDILAAAAPVVQAPPALLDQEGAARTD